MVLADTSIWIRHFRARDADLEDLLDHQQAAIHEFVLGELACGNLRDRESTLADLGRLPRIRPATADEVLFFIGHHRLYGSGLGWIDMHLLASARLEKVTLYTRDRALAEASAKLGVAFRPRV